MKRKDNDISRVILRREVCISCKRNEREKNTTTKSVKYVKSYNEFRYKVSYKKKMWRMKYFPYDFAQFVVEKWTHKERNKWNKMKKKRYVWRPVYFYTLTIHRNESVCICLYAACDRWRSVHVSRVRIVNTEAPVYVWARASERL